MFFLLDVAPELDLHEINTCYRQKDRRCEKAYDTRMEMPSSAKRLLVLDLNACCVGLPNSRQFEKAYWEDAALRVLMGEQPLYRSRISDFCHRQQCAAAGLDRLSEACCDLQISRLCRMIGLVSIRHDRLMTPDPGPISEST